MIKLPKEISEVFKNFEKKGHEIYAVGGCVRDSFMGENPLDWDLATNATMEEMISIIPEAKVISEKYQVVRLDLTEEKVLVDSHEEEGLIIDIARFRKEEDYDSKGNPNEVEFVNKIEEDLPRRDFTINSIAINPAKGICDPYEGREDLRKKIIRVTGNPQERYREDPIRMLRAIRIASQLGFDIGQKDYEAMIDNAQRLESVSVDKRRKEFEELIVSEYAGKGLRMLAGADLMPTIIGDAALHISGRQRELFSTLADNIGRTQKNLKRRLGLFYLCFEKKNGLKAIEVLNYDNKTKENLTDALTLLDRLYFLRKGVEIKEWLVKYGEERFYYMQDLTKAQRIVYDLSEIKVASRHYILQDIKNRNEPVFIEDLAVTGADLINAGIAEGENIGAILTELLDIVHRRPDFNTKDNLLAEAKKLAKNPLKRATRKVKWIR